MEILELQKTIDKFSAEKGFIPFFVISDVSILARKKLNEQLALYLKPSDATILTSIIEDSETPSKGTLIFSVSDSSLMERMITALPSLETKTSNFKYINKLSTFHWIDCNKKLHHIGTYPILTINTNDTNAKVIRSSISKAISSIIETRHRVNFNNFSIDLEKTEEEDVFNINLTYNFTTSSTNTTHKYRQQLVSFYKMVNEVIKKDDNTTKALKDCKKFTQKSCYGKELNEKNYISEVQKINTFL